MLAISAPRTSHSTSHRCDRRPAQRGSVLVQFALFLSVVVLILGIVDLGYSFYAKRDLQRIADLAAIEAVQGIDFQSSNSNKCVNAGATSIDKNWPAPLSPISKIVVCGEWNSQKYTGPRHFRENATPLNSAHVKLEAESPRFFPGTWERKIFAEAIAQRSAPTAAFQVGSQLLDFKNDKLLGKLLTFIGLDASKLSVLDADGLANAKISPAGLLKALGVDLGIDGLTALSPQQIANLNNLTLLQILDASLNVVADNTLSADLRAAIDVLKDLKIGSTKLLDMKIPLLGSQEENTPGIFTFLSLGKQSSPNGAALDAQIDVSSLLKTSIMLGVNGHALSIPELDILGLIKTKLTIVEPPTIAVGPIGTRANNAQVRLNIDIDTRPSLINGLLSLLLGNNTFINIPIQVDGVSADATLDGIQCPDPGRDNQPSMDLFVESRVAKISIGSAEPLLQIKGKTIVASPRKTVQILKAADESINSLIKNESKWTHPNDLLLGDTLGSITDLVFSVLGALLGVPPSFDPSWDIPPSMSQEEIKKLQIEALAKAYIDKSNSQGQALNNIDRIINVILNGSSDGEIAPLVDSDFIFNNAIPTTCLLVVCPTNLWKTGSFSDAFKQYSGTPGSILDLLGISTLPGGYTSCAGLLSSLLTWNSCLENNLKNLLLKNSSHVNLGNANQILNSLKDGSTSSVSCTGLLCVLVDGLLAPVKKLLNGVGKSILSPLLTGVLGLEAGRNEVKALEINCNSAQLVY